MPQPSFGTSGLFRDCEEEVIEGINLFKVDNFMEVWNSESVASWRKRLLENGRQCPLYQI